ncbi:MAG: hypothetical protein HYV96_11265 [Opitutae bacterium]|nr:hypothetical protein [Opitutae bacterium]
MHRIPKSIDLTPLLGLEVMQIAISQNEVIFRLHPEGEIRLEGAWILKRGDKTVIDRSMEHAKRDAWCVHEILGNKITRCVVRDERHLEVHFADAVLEIEDDSDYYETFAIEHSALKLYV